MRVPLRYLLALAFTPLVLAVATVSLAVAIDPYRLFGTAPIAGWTELKPRAYQQADLAKTYMLERARPATLLLGNSRVEVGLDPQSPYWPTGLRPVFNAALAGHDLFSALLFLQHDLAIKVPRLVVLGLDFQDFIQAGSDPSEPAVSAAERRMRADRNGVANPRRDLQIWSDAVASTLTIDALTDSLMTLAQQNASTGATMTAAGFNPLREYLAIVRREGAHSLFAQKQAMYESQYRSFRPSDFRKPQDNPEFRYLISIVKACAAHHVRLIVFTYPYHAQYFELLRSAGLWQSFEAWKDALVRTLARTAANTGGDVRLFDFAQVNRISSEPIPETGDMHTQMRWYWEAGHFKSALGDKLIARMMGKQNGLGALLLGSDAVFAKATPGSTQEDARADRDPVQRR